MSGEVDLKQIDTIVKDKYEADPENLIHILQEINSNYNYLPEPAINRVAERLNIPLTQVYSVSTFYKSFSLEPRGKHLITVCLGTACHVRGGQKLLEQLERKLKIKAGKTTPDRKFTLETVSCLGCCALAPVMVIDEKYYERAKNEQKVRFVKSQVHRIYCDENDNLILRYIENNKIKEEEFDLVVLSVGIKPKVANQELLKKLGLDLNEHGFCQVSNFAPVNTSKDGIFTAGAFSGPKDIPETVMEASAAASEASCIISSARHTLTSKKEYPQEKDIAGEKQRIGVFVCHCGVNIGSVVDVNEVKSYAGTLPNVVYTDN